MADVISPERRSSKSSERVRKPIPLSNKIAIGIFGLLVTAGPLAFGAVDRITQIVLLGIFTAGLLTVPPKLVPIPRWGKVLLYTLLGVVLFKEFLPAGLFGKTLWREELVGGLGMSLSWTHHPEPARVLEALAGFGVAGLWFLWVRTLGIDREQRTLLLWGLFGAALVVAIVSFATKGIDPKAIYGLRYTPGWFGFGPFPNRNHTADFLAMGMVIGCGCAAWAGTRKWWKLSIGAGLLSGFLFVGILATQSRGGLLAAGAGLACFTIFVLLKTRNRWVLSVIAGGLLLFGALALLFGAQVFGRFQSKEGGEVSTMTRVAVWKDAATMWQDAPLFGHGMDTFPQLFGLYQSVRLENQVVLHPESSWLQWLNELGVVAVLLAAGGTVIFCWGHLKQAFQRQSGFFQRAAAFSAVGVLVVHCLIDVPAHRWGTAGFALAALALACPLRSDLRKMTTFKKAALIPLGVGLFWALPFLIDGPAWSTLQLNRLLARETTLNEPKFEQLQSAAKYFPLNADLQQALGMRQLRLLNRQSPAVWQRHFAAASALMPASWRIPVTQAVAVERIAPGLAMSYWQQAVDRCSLHRQEILGRGVKATAKVPLSNASWTRYVEANPDLLLTYAELVNDQHARELYHIWWRERALTGKLTELEITTFYRNVADWGTVEQFEKWTDHHAALKTKDFRFWAAQLHRWGDDQRAFALLSEFIAEPQFPKNPPGSSLTQLEAVRRVSPQNLVNAQQLAHARSVSGDQSGSDELIITVAQSPQAPPWFLHRAAYAQARSQKYKEAVDLLLR